MKQIRDTDGVYRREHRPLERTEPEPLGKSCSTVNDLAEQSNLLAVNASIEAAKAGEQGKGFAVVAQEVRNLAEQSKQATIQVRSILNDIQKATNAAVMVTEQGSKAVEAGVKQSPRPESRCRSWRRASGDRPGRHPDCRVEPAADGGYGPGGPGDGKHQDGEHTKRGQHPANGDGGKNIGNWDENSPNWWRCTRSANEQSPCTGECTEMKSRDRILPAQQERTLGPSAVCSQCLLREEMGSMDKALLKKLLATFQVEARGARHCISSGLVELEKASSPEAQMEVVERVFREAHSLKGAARAVNLVKVEAACQSLESLFARLKAREITVSPVLFDQLHRMVDTLGVLLSLERCATANPHASP